MTTTWVILVIIFIGATAVGGSGFRRYSALERRVVTTEGALAERDARIAGLMHHLNEMRSQLADARLDLTTARRTLRTTQSLLQEAANDIRTANDVAEQERREAAILSACLAGAAQALHHMGAADHYRALSAMTSVDRECREAQALMAGQ